MYRRHNAVLPVAALFVMACVGLFLTGTARAADAPEIAQYTLDNGMEVVVIEDHRTPVVVHSVWYKVGAADEPYGKSGIAHFLEHLMFRGTEDVPDGEFSAIVAQNGGRQNAFTSNDYTGYYQMVAKDRLPLVMELEADRMVNLQLTDAVVQPERKVIIEERSSRIDNRPGALLGEQMRAMQYQHHPYREPVIGWLSEIEKLSQQDAEDFYERYYTPANAILIVVGDISGSEVLELAEEYYGPLPHRPISPRERVVEPPQLAPRDVTLTHQDVGQPIWRRSYLAPSAHRGMTQHAPALEVLAEYLGGGSLSQLYQSLVVDQKIAASAAAFYSPVQFDLSTFGVYAVPVPGQSLDALETAVEAEIEKVKAGEIDAEALERAKTLLKADVIYARDNIMSMMQIYGSVLTSGLDVNYVADWAGTIDAVTVEDLTAAAQTVIVADRSVTGRLLPAPRQAGGQSTAPQPGGAGGHADAEPVE